MLSRYVFESKAALAFIIRMQELPPHVCIHPLHLMIVTLSTSLWLQDNTSIMATAIPEERKEERNPKKAFRFRRCKYYS